MSVSLILLPVGLAMYAIMGKKNFEKWAESLQIKIPTSFASKSELASVVQKAGYDANDWGGMVKTHIRGEQLFFFWQQIDGKWVAVFGKSDPQSDIKSLIANVEKAAGRAVFDTEVLAEVEAASISRSPTEPPPLKASKAPPKKASAAPRRRIKVLPQQTYPTNFRDRDLLLRVLAEYTMNPTVDSQGRITCETANCKLLFAQQRDQPFSVEVLKAPQMSEVFQDLNQLNGRYCEVIQADTVRSVKARLADKGLALEQEEILPDNTVVLTVQIQ